MQMLQALVLCPLLRRILWQIDAFHSFYRYWLELIELFQWHEVMLSGTSDASASAA